MPFREGPAAKTVKAIHPLWQQDFYEMNQKVVSLGRTFYIRDASKNLIGYCEGSYLKLKDEFHIYGDENKNEELLQIKQEQMLDVWGNFAVRDMSTGALAGYLKRDFVGSWFISDKWNLLQPDGSDLGLLSEPSASYAFFRRMFGMLPMKFEIFIRGGGGANIKLERKFITFGTWWIDCRGDPRRVIDRRLVLAGVILLEAVEKAHEDR